MESLWSSLLVVAGVFTAFSGAASVWARVQRRRHERQSATWQTLLQPDGAQPDLAPAATAESAATQAPRPRRRALPPDPSAADSPSFVSDSDSRRAALDAALDRMSRRPHEPAGPSPDWEDTSPSVNLGSALPRTANPQRPQARSSKAA